jgi:hypothetical protein
MYFLLKKLQWARVAAGRLQERDMKINYRLKDIHRTGGEGGGLKRQN